MLHRIAEGIVVSSLQPLPSSRSVASLGPAGANHSGSADRSFTASVHGIETRPIRPKQRRRYVAEVRSAASCMKAASF